MYILKILKIFHFFKIKFKNDAFTVQRSCSAQIVYLLVWLFIGCLFIGCLFIGCLCIGCLFMPIKKCMINVFYLCQYNKFMINVFYLCRYNKFMKNILYMN